MVTFQEVVHKLEDAIRYFSDLNQRLSHNKSDSRFNKAAIVAEILSHDLLDKQPIIPDKTVPIGLSLEQVVDLLKVRLETEGCHLVSASSVYVKRDYVRAVEKYTELKYIFGV